jgi:hypothetical protein
MDPYLEGPAWMSFHAQFTSEIARQLTPRLLPKYLAHTTERFVVEDPEDVAVTADIYPDVPVKENQATAPIPTAVALAPAPLKLHTVMPRAIPQRAVEIRDLEERQLVTAIEVLSPANKRGTGRREYLAKRRRILVSTAHLLEVDLLRRGRRLPMREALPPHPYFVFLSREGRRPETDTWPVAFDQPLPTVPVPLLAGDPDVPLDLQLALTSVYDQLGYRFALNYSRPPRVRLTPDQAAIADPYLRPFRPPQTP